MPKGLSEYWTYEDWKQTAEKKNEEAGSNIYDRFMKLFIGAPDVAQLLLVVGKDRIEAWLDQFKNDCERDLAFFIFKKIKYYDAEDVMTLCRTNYCNWLTSTDSSVDKTIFIPVGEAGKSGNMVGYLFRMANGISANSMKNGKDILSNDDIDNEIQSIVFLDDYSGTGDQFITDETVRRIIEKVGENVKLSFIPLVISSQAKYRIENELNISVFSQHVREPVDFTEEELALADRYGKGLFTHKGNDLSLGWGGLAETIVFFYNVPNNTLPIIWSDGYSSETGEKWIPLFNRVIPSGNSSDIPSFHYLVDHHMYTEDYQIYFGICSDVYSRLLQGKISFSLDDYVDYTHFVTILMHPFVLFTDYETPFGFLQNIRVKMLKRVGKLVKEGKVPIDKLLDPFVMDRSNRECANRLRTEYADIVTEYVLKENIDISCYYNIINYEKEEIDNNIEILYKTEGLILIASSVMNARDLLPQERYMFKNLRREANNESIRFWSERLLAKYERRKRNYLGINLKEVFLLVNYSGMDSIYNAEDAIRYGLYPH